MLGIVAGLLKGPIAGLFHPQVIPPLPLPFAPDIQAMFPAYSGDRPMAAGQVMIPLKPFAAELLQPSFKRQHLGFDLGLRLVRDVARRPAILYQPGHALFPVTPQPFPHRVL